VQRVIQVVTIGIAVLASLACSGNKSIDAGQLRSELISTRSIATEAETFLDYVAQGRTTEKYAQGHLEYLADKVGDSVEQLKKAEPQPSIRQTFDAAQPQLTALQTELVAARNEIADADAVRARRQRIAEIHAALESAEHSL